MRTLTVRKGGSNYATGWHALTITKAKYGTYEEKKFLDVWFDGYPENFTLRVYEKHNKSNEEFAIGNIFRFANAGISDVLDGPDGNMVVKINDEPAELTDKTLNVYFYKDGEYSRALKQVAPTPFSNVVESFNDDDVEYWKTRAEKYYTEYVKDSSHSNGAMTSTETTTEDIPF